MRRPKINGIELHLDITCEAIAEAVQEDRNSGWCIICGTEHDGIEPDAENYECENCRAEQVFGIESLLIAIT
jgi:hypothetical protein